MTGQRTLKIEAARAGVDVGEYQARLSQGQLWCYRCQVWHPAGTFPADGRRHTGRAGSCSHALRAAARDALAERGQLPPPQLSPPSVWVVRRQQSCGGLADGQAWAYWRGPGREAAGMWSPALDDDVARFPAADEARAALVAAFGRTGAVPPGCRLARLA